MYISKHIYIYICINAGHLNLTPTYLSRLSLILIPGWRTIGPFTPWWNSMHSKCESLPVQSFRSLLTASMKSLRPPSVLNHAWITIHWVEMPPSSTPLPSVLCRRTWQFVTRTKACLGSNNVGQGVHDCEGTLGPWANKCCLSKCINTVHQRFKKKVMFTFDKLAFLRPRVTWWRRSSETFRSYGQDSEGLIVVGCVGWVWFSSLYPFVKW